MMDVILICLTAFLVAGLTLFSGFGLGTLLMPVFALFFPLQMAIMLTAIVHLLNNLLKLTLLGRHADRQVVLQFGVPALLAAFLGAWVLDHMSEVAPWIQYQLFEQTYQVIPVKFVIAIVLIAFTLLELTLKENTLSFNRKYLPVGGLLSGFFGGLSGHQGALRSAFLIKCGLSKERFLGSGVVIACVVDIARLAVYGVTFSSNSGEAPLGLLLAIVASAFAGTWVGSQLLHKVTIRTIPVVVVMMVLGIAVGLGAGLI